jgi:hypothetical protein
LRAIGTILASAREVTVREWLALLFASTIAPSLEAFETYSAGVIFALGDEVLQPLACALRTDIENLDHMAKAQPVQSARKSRERHDRAPPPPSEQGTVAECFSDQRRPLARRRHSDLSEPGWSHPALSSLSGSWRRDKRQLIGRLHWMGWRC